MSRYPEVVSWPPLDLKGRGGGKNAAGALESWTAGWAAGLKLWS